MKYWQILSWVSLLSATPASALEKPLFERLGRNKGIEALSARFISHLSKDARLNDNPGIKTMKKEISELEATHRLASALNKASGGPAKASRADLLKGIKAEVELGAREWFYVIQDANQAMDEQMLAAKERKDLLTLLLRVKDH